MGRLEERHGGSGTGCALRCSHGITASPPASQISYALMKLTTSCRGQAAPQGEAEQLHQAFTLVPLTHPAYTACKLLAEDMGVPTGYPTRAFCTGKPLSRYEFACAIQRMHLMLHRTVLWLDDRLPASAKSPPPPPEPGSLPPGSAPPGVWFDERKLHETFQDAGKLRSTFVWHAPLVEEFAQELKWLGSDVALMQREVAGWKQSTAGFAKKAKGVFAS